MKKRTQRRRQSPSRATAPGEVRAAGRTQGTTPRRIGWLAGLGLVLLLGLLAFSWRGRPGASRAETPGGSNTGGVAPNPQAGGRPGERIDFAPPLGAGISSSSPLTPRDAARAAPALRGDRSTAAAGTNPPGTVANREREGRVADLNEQAKRLLEAGDSQRAIDLFQQARALAPTNETIHFNLGIAFTVADDLTNAEQEYKEAIRLLPDYPEAHAKYGNLLLRLGRLAEAEEQLSEAVEQMPESAQSQNSLGVVRQRRNETNEALLCFQKAIECDSNCMEGHFNLAQVYLLRKNRAKEIAELHETLRINPAYEPAQRALARVMGQGEAGAPAPK
jgi:Flp pilus assembly protein TadD